MQAIVVAKPYRFVPPKGGRFWPALLGLFRRRFTRKEGISAIECRGLDKLVASQKAGHGIILAPNHCRPVDPFVVSELGYVTGSYVHIMASSHLFAQGRMQAFMLRRAGAFSVYREGLDREALKCAIQIVAEAKRPLILFPEGVISRHNDRLNSLMDGVAMIARSAAKQRAAKGGKVVIHPVCVRYRFEGDLPSTVGPMLEAIERRLSWQPAPELSPVELIGRIGAALLSLKESEILGAPREGAIGERLAHLIDRILCPIEAEWVKGRREADVVSRVKLLRMALVPDLVSGELSAHEQEERWRLLGRLYLAQQLAFYPDRYLSNDPTPERILETVERFEEDLNDVVRAAGPLRAIVEVGEAIEVPLERVRGAEDPVMVSLRTGLQALIGQTLAHARPGSSLP
jgi:1-acyl-sn-glycerol-3-phosphate acyltransferase